MSPAKEPIGLTPQAEPGERAPAIGPNGCCRIARFSDSHIPPARDRDRPSPNPRALCIQRLRTRTNSRGINWRQERLEWPSVCDAPTPTQRVQVGLANLWQTAVGGYRPRDRSGTGPGLCCWFVVEPPPESNRRPHPYHGSAAKRRANPHRRRPPSTVRGTVMGDLFASTSGGSAPALAVEGNQQSGTARPWDRTLASQGLV